MSHLPPTTRRERGGPTLAAKQANARCMRGPVLTLLRVAGCLALLGGLAGGTHAIGQPMPAGTYRFDRAVVVDYMGQTQPMPVGTLFIPHGWRTEGGALWDPQFACTHYLGIRWQATSPDGRSAMGWLPQMAWEQNNTGNPAPLRPGCTQQAIPDAGTYLRRAAQLYWPGARVLDYRSRPDLMSIKAPMTRPTPGGGQTTTRSDAGQMVLAFEHQGQEMRALLVVAVDFEHTRLPIPGGAGQLLFTNAAALPLFAATAPSGQFDPRLAEAVRASYQVNPVWMKRVTDHVAKLHQIGLEGAAQRREIWRNTSEQIGQMITQGWQAQQRSADQRALDFSQMIRGVETYRDANGRGTELQSGYAHAWRLNDGSYLLSTQVNFDPGRDLGLSGQRLTPQR